MSSLRAYSNYFDAVIDQLTERGVADATRIGLQGWSRTGFAVRAALQSGRHKYGAAVLVDSMSGGYGQPEGAPHQCRGPDPADG